MGLNRIFKQQDFFYYLKQEYDITEKSKQLVKSLNDNIRLVNMISAINNNDLFYLETNPAGVPQSFMMFADEMAWYLKEGIEGTILSEENHEVKIAPLADSLTIKPFETEMLPIEITNDEENIMLTSEYDNPFVLSYHIVDSAGNVIVKDGIRTKLESDIYPGETYEMEMRIDAPAIPGEYILQISYLHENLIWGEKLDETLPITIPLYVQGD